MNNAFMAGVIIAIALGGVCMDGAGAKAGAFALKRFEALSVALPPSFGRGSAVPLTLAGIGVTAGDVAALTAGALTARALIAGALTAGAVVTGAATTGAVATGAVEEGVGGVGATVAVAGVVEAIFTAGRLVENLYGSSVARVMLDFEAGDEAV